MIVIEDILGRCAPLLGVEPEDLRRNNFYEPGQATPTGSRPDAERLAEIWSILNERSELPRPQDSDRRVQRRASAHQTRPGDDAGQVRHLIHLTAFNQAGALVHVYKDGSVLINHGGAEMGQGLHTR